MLQCSAPRETAEAWNAARPEGEAYSEAVFKDLWGRYEEPDSRNRWDKPLFRLNAQRQEESAAILQVKLQRDIPGYPSSMQARQDGLQSLSLYEDAIVTHAYIQKDTLQGSMRRMERYVELCKSCTPVLGLLKASGHTDGA